MSHEHQEALNELDDILSNIGDDADLTSAPAGTVVRRVAEKEGIDESRIKQVLETLKTEEIQTVADLRLVPRTAWSSLGIPLGLAYKIQEELGARPQAATPPAMLPLSSPTPSTFLLNNLVRTSTDTASSTPAPAVARTPAASAASSAMKAPSSGPTPKARGLSGRATATSGVSSTSPQPASAPIAVPPATVPPIGNLSTASHSTPSASSPAPAQRSSPRPGGWTGAKPSVNPSPNASPLLSSSPRPPPKSPIPDSSVDAPRRISPASSPRPGNTTPSSEVSASQSSSVPLPLPDMRPTAEALLSYVELRLAPSSQMTAAQVAQLFDSNKRLSAAAMAVLTELAASRRWTLTRYEMTSESPAALGGDGLRIQSEAHGTVLVTVTPSPPFLVYNARSASPSPSLSSRPAPPSLGSSLAAMPPSDPSTSSTSAPLSPTTPRSPAVSVPALVLSPSPAVPPARAAASSAPISPRLANGLVSPRNGAEAAHVLHKRRLLQKGAWADVQMIFPTCKLPAHSFVLLASAENLLSAKDRKELEKRRKKHDSSVYHVDHASNKQLAALPIGIFELMLDYIYTNDVSSLPRLPVKDLIGLCHVATRFKLDRLAWHAEKALRPALSADNVHAAMRLAADLHEKDLVRLCTLCALKNYTLFIGNKAGITLIGIELYSDVVREAAQLADKHVDEALQEMRPEPRNEYAAQWASILEELPCADGVARFVWGTDSQQRPLLRGDHIRFHKALLGSLSDSLHAFVREAPAEEVLFFITPDSFKALLHYVYTGDTAFTVLQAADLIPFAQRTHSTDLFRLLDDRIRNPAELTVDNVLHILSATYLPYMRDRADIQRSRAAALAFFFEHITEMDLTPLRHMAPATAIELLFAAQADAQKGSQ